MWLTLYARFACSSGERSPDGHQNMRAKPAPFLTKLAQILEVIHP